MAQAGTVSFGSNGFDWNSLTKQFAKGEYALGLGVMALVLMLIVPIPSFLLDFLLAISINPYALHSLELALAKDRAKTNVNGFSQLGLVEMTRKRTRESLAHLLCEPCPTCGGRGEVKTARTVAYEILRELLREARQFNPREFRVVASARVVELFLDEESQHLAGLSDFIKKPISLQAESAMGQEQYDIVLL